MTVRRRYWLPALVALAACGGGSTAPSTSSSPDTSIPVTTATFLPSTTSSTAPAHDLAAELAGQIQREQLMADVATLAAAPRADDAAREATRQWVEQQLTAAGYTVQRWTRAHPEASPAVPVNLVARREGTGGGVLLVTAHYDSVATSPGADDNASGVAVVLAVARALAASDAEVGTTVEFVLFDLEEVGLVGSAAYAQEATQGREIVGVINLESVGYTCAEPGCQVVFSDVPGCLDVGGDESTGLGDNIAVVGADGAAEVVAAFATAAERVAPALRVGTGLVAGDGGCLAATRRSDHAPFWNLGIPAVMVTDTAEFRNVNYHQPTDVVETLDPAFLTNVARATAGAVALLITSSFGGDLSLADTSTPKPGSNLGN